MSNPLPDRPRKGRGAVSNASGRYEAEQRSRVDDGWTDGAAWEGDPPPLRTTQHVDTARRIITRNQSPDIPFDQSINPYRGCEHGCVYCFARPTHAYLGLSPGLDFESQLFFKPDAAARLETELRKPGYRPAVIAMGTNTDPYQPIERERRITRSILEVLARYRHPVSIVTKSALVTRDLDILGPMAAAGLATANLSVTTLDRRLARTMEPRASTPPRRLAAIRALSAAGVPAGLMFAPVIPAINDAEMEDVLAAGAEAGATSAGYILVRLPLEIEALFQEWLTTHFPDRARRVMTRLRDMRGGDAYRAEWGTRMTGTGPEAELLRRRFELASRKHGLDRRDFGLDTAQFRPPPRSGDQLTLL
jgi:DNA repair photolyase